MFKAAAPQLRVCSACLRTGAPLRASRAPPQRWALSRQTSQWSYSTTAETSEHDVIREVFDHSDRSSNWFPSITPGSRLRPSGKNAGLFKNRYLTRPEGFQVFAYHNLQRASVLVDRILNASTIEEYRQVVRNLDRLSDLLCRVLDLCDFVRMTHPDHRYQTAANDAWSIVYQYMNQLNTTTGLNDQLCKAMDTPEVTAGWSEEEMIVAKTLRIDFEKSGVHLPENVRSKFVDLSQQISEVGSEFIGTMAPEKYYVQLPAAKFTGLRPDILASNTRGGYVRLGSVDGTTTAALRSVLDEDVRKALYLASNTASRQTIALLEEMLRLRGELANLTGFESFAHQNMKDRVMAKTPGAVVQFLKALQKHNAPIVQQEVADLLQVKRDLLGPHHWGLNAWDREFCTQSVKERMKAESIRGIGPTSNQLSDYFSVGTVIKGLSMLYNRLYGIRLVPRETLPGEVWHPDVRRLDVVSENGELLAVLYCDLFYREAKSQNPAHYTIRCSRDILDTEIEEVALGAGREGLPKFDSAEMAANDGMEAVREGGILKQLPTIALVCDFTRHGGSDPATLVGRDVETLFHEMGHAVHSFLARTSFQTVAGTRCATDLAELPSTLMEHFAVDPTVLSLFARHWKTGEPVPYEQVAARVRMSKRFEGLQTERQIILAMADQAYHSAIVCDPDFSSSKVYHQIQAEFAVGPRDDPSTSWHGFFGHLHGYGSTYYSYLFDRVLAERVWRVVFKSGESGAAISRENGEWLKEKLLQWGGSRDPWRCLADTLGDGRIAAGDEKAMAIVGSWGIKDEFHP
ncbi:hypothetical protein jhhlp_002293 [Lomentospora prolificans]|uniref:Mitochondrial intermediate peptidase n=1 Tax=Lomentospora prolificans TaxID=41688 RepID=A0A2N3NDN6_9PEZI|nr:hypothetical protein jhhlp_002293 [Lomentospora prolificans]